MAIMLRYPHGLRKALTLSYDDGVEQDIRLMEILDKHGIRCTFNINSGLFAPEGFTWPEGTIHRRMTRSRAIALYKDTPHEVAVHCLKHTSLTELPQDQVAWEILADRNNLEHDFGGMIRGMAYPFGTFNDEVVNTLRMCGVLYSRTVISTHNFEIPQDWLRLGATCHHADPALMKLCDAFLADDCHSRSKLFYLWGHAYEFEAADNWQVIEQFAEKMGGHPEIWYATNGEIARYCEAWKQLIFSADRSRVYNPTQIDLWLEDEHQVVCVPAGAAVNCPNT